MLRFDQPIVASDNRLSYACILLFPASTQYPAGSPFFTDFQVPPKKQNIANITCIKNREFDGFLGFLAGSCEGAYFGVRNRAGFCQNAEKAQIIGF